MQAQFDFEPLEKGDLQLIKGDIVTVLDKIEENWWKGKKTNGRVGIFPVSYVKEIVSYYKWLSSVSHFVQVKTEILFLCAHFFCNLAFTLFCSPVPYNRLFLQA